MPIKPFDNLVAFLKEFFEKVNVEKSQQTTKKNYPVCEELKNYSSESSLSTFVIRTIF